MHRIVRSDLYAQVKIIERKNDQDCQDYQPQYTYAGLFIHRVFGYSSWVKNLPQNGSKERQEPINDAGYGYPQVFHKNQSNDNEKDKFYEPALFLFHRYILSQAN